MKKYIVTVEDDDHREHTYKVLVHNENVIDRVLNNEDNWLDTFYDLDEQEVVEMLAYNIGFMGFPLSHLDGWANCKDTDVAVYEQYT